MSGHFHPKVLSSEDFKTLFKFFQKLKWLRSYDILKLRKMMKFLSKIAAEKTAKNEDKTKIQNG